MSLETSVVVPVYNDPTGIATTLSSLVEQTYDRYEIIPVDNGSTDGTRRVMESIAHQHPEYVSVVEETEVQGSYAARNAGIERASGEVFLFLDADMWVDETWVEDMVLSLESRRCDYLGCNVEVEASDGPNTLWEAYERALAFPIETYLEQKQFVPTCALAVRREVFDDVGLFDARLVSGGDKEFGQRVYRAGFDQRYDGSITAYHPARNSLRALLSKAERIGRGREQVRHYHPEVGGHVHPLHPVNFLPPSPSRLRRRYSPGSIPTPAVVSLYLIEYVLKLAQTGSSIRGMIAIRRDR